MPCQVNHGRSLLTSSPPSSAGPSYGYGQTSQPPHIKSACYLALSPIYGLSRDTPSHCGAHASTDVLVNSCILNTAGNMHFVDFMFESNVQQAVPATRP